MGVLDTASVRLVASSAEACELMSWLSERRPVLAVDTETSGLSPFESGARIRLAQIGDGQTGWAIPWEDWRGVFLEALSVYDGPLVMHNASFDVKWLERHSPLRLPWARLHDTMIMGQVLDSTRRNGLKDLATRLVDRSAAVGETILHDAMREHNWTWDTVPVEYETYWAYAAMDTILTSQLYEQFKPKIDADFRTAYDLEMAARRVCTAMEANGARVDMEYSQRTYDRLFEYAESIKTWGKAEFNIHLTSPKQLVGQFLSMGVELEKQTESGALSMDKDVLDDLTIHEDPGVAQLAKTVLSMRKAYKLAGTYFANFLEDGAKFDGIVHPSIQTMGARTTRMSIRQPALQTLNKGEKTVREAFIPRDPGSEVLLSCDYSQIEFRLLANFSHDPGLITLFNEADAKIAAGDPDGDVFTAMVKDIYHDPAATKKDKRRKLTKAMLYGRIYGASPRKMAITAGVPEAEMIEVNKAFDVRYPGMSRFMEETSTAGINNMRASGRPYTETMFGHRLYGDEDRIYALTNYRIQGSASGLLKQAIVALDAAGLGEMLVVPVHDEIVMSIPAESAKEIAHLVQDVMSFRDGWDVPILADTPALGANWGELID